MGKTLLSLPSYWVAGDSQHRDREVKGLLSCKPGESLGAGMVARGAKHAHSIPNTHCFTFPWPQPHFLSQGAIINTPYPPQRVRGPGEKQSWPKHAHHTHTAVQSAPPVAQKLLRERTQRGSHTLKVIRTALSTFHTQIPSCPS